MKEFTQVYFCLKIDHLNNCLTEDGLFIYLYSLDVRLVTSARNEIIGEPSRILVEFVIFTRGQGMNPSLIPPAMG